MLVRWVQRTHNTEYWYWNRPKETTCKDEMETEVEIIDEEESD
jgi:hypothetical protein